MSTEIMRLDRWLSQHGVGSRKEVGILIRKGFVVVNGEAVEKANTKVAENDDVEVDGVKINLSRFVYYMMNKPSGILSATRDRKEKTVIDILPKEFVRPGLFPAGRLDKDTEGFLIITNDGEFSHRILSPKRKVPKTYYVKLDSVFDFDKIKEAFDSGLDIGSGQATSSANIKLIEMSENPLVELTIYEGMFHQVKRMFLTFGLEVIYLKRIRIGQLDLDPDLQLGETRKITDIELEKIYISNKI